MLDVQGVVTNALDALGFQWRWSSNSIIDAGVPSQVRHHFGGRHRLRLTFDPTVWEMDRNIELIVPGCSMLDGIESCLRANDAARSIAYGGSITPNPGLVEEWHEQVNVQNAQLIQEHNQLTWIRALRFMFEARLPGPPPTVELIPVFFELDTHRVLTAVEASRLMARDRQWYEHSEVRAFLSAPAVWPAPEETIPAFRAAADVTKQRIQIMLAGQGARRQREIEDERARLEKEHNYRWSEAENDAERQQIRAEHSRRLHLLDESLHAGARIRLISATLMTTGEQLLELEYQSARSGTTKLIRPKIEHGHLLLDMCSWCKQPRKDYLLAPDQPGLVCTHCGTQCKDPACDHVLETRQRPLCAHCSEPTWCEAHTMMCTQCGKRCCPDHGGHASCCENIICSTHILMDSQTGDPLCPDHAACCTVDNQWRHIDRTVHCESTARVFWEGYRQPLDDDPRTLHPDEIVACASSGRLVARDRAKPCVADGELHHPDQLVACGQTGAMLCPVHRGEVLQPRIMVVDKRRIEICKELGVPIDRSVAGTCSVSNDRFLLEKLVTCPVTGKLLHPGQAIVLEDDGRLLHPDAVMQCSSSSRSVARDRIVLDQLAQDAPLHPMAATQCEYSGKTTATNRTRIADCCGRRIANDWLTPSSISSKLVCANHRQHCEEHSSWVMPDEARACAISHRKLCTVHTVKAACCDRHVAHARTLPLEGGGCGCTDHYVRCVEGSHVVAKAETTLCATTGKAVCEQHRATCTCCDTVHQRAVLLPNPYAPTELFCKRNLLTCKSCELVAPKAPSDISTCSYCAAASQPDWVLGSGERDAYLHRVKPLLPWYQLNWKVRISGTVTLTVVRIRTMLGSDNLYRVHLDGPVEAREGGKPWRLINGA